MENKYFKFFNIHIFIFLSLKYYDIQIGTVDKSYGFNLRYGKMHWHTGLFTLTITKNISLIGAPGYDIPSDIECWGYNDWSFYPIFGFKKKFPISSEELIMNELLGENKWEGISRYNTLTLNQLEEFKDKLHWDIISYRYKMDYEFIQRNKDKIVMNKLENNKKISKRLKQRILRDMLNGKF